MSLQYSPLEDRVLIKPKKKTELETTGGGILKPLTAKSDTSEGTVVAAGPGKYAPETGVFMPVMLSRGDLVLYGSAQGLPIEIEVENVKEEVLILREGDILLLISKKSAE